MSVQYSTRPGCLGISHDPTWPEWGGLPDRYYPWHVWTSPLGAHHAGFLLDTVIGPDVVTGQPRTYEVLRCEPCIGIHVTPLPAPDALKRFYETQFYQSEKPRMVQHYTEDMEWWQECVYRPIFDVCASLLHLESDTTQARFVDIGAGVGLALATVKRARNWHTWGIEINTDRCEALRAQGHTMLQGTLEDHLEALRVYRPHIGLLYETLEHSPEPESMLLQCYDMLEDGGLLVVVVPNDASPLQYAVCRQRGITPYWWAPPLHLQAFTPKCLQLLLRRCGFLPLYARGTYPMEQFILTGRNYLAHGDIGRACHHDRVAMELAAVREGRWTEIEQEYQENLRQGIGREMLFICRKSD